MFQTAAFTFLLLPSPECFILLNFYPHSFQLTLSPTIRICSPYFYSFLPFLLLSPAPISAFDPFKDMPALPPGSAYINVVCVRATKSGWYSSGAVAWGWRQRHPLTPWTNCLSVTMLNLFYFYELRRSQKYFIVNTKKPKLNNNNEQKQRLF